MWGQVGPEEKKAFPIAHIRANSWILPLHLFFSPANGAWRLVWRHCARSCKINPCIFKEDANESAWWTGLLAWHLITSVVPFANEFTFPLSLSLSSFPFCSRSLPMSPATHSAGPCHEFQISGVTASKKEKKILPFQTPISFCIQHSGWCCRRTCGGASADSFLWFFWFCL